MGANEIIVWLADVVNNGITTLYNQPEEFWDSICKRMVDAQLSGISNRLKHVKRAIAQEEEEYVIDAISEIYLLAKSLSRIDDLPEDMVLSLLKAGGYNITKKHLLNAELISDDWLVLGLVHGEEDRIRYRRTWIQGQRTKFMGQILDYAWGKQEYMQNWQAGRTFKGDVRIYPGSYRLRVSVEAHTHSAQLIGSYAAYSDLTAFLKAYTSAIAANPVLYRFPVCLKEVRIQIKNQEIYIIDKLLNAIPCFCSENAKWGLLAAAIGQEIQLFAEWDGSKLLPLSLISRERFIKVKNNI
jgi:hypothetical protein